MEGPTEHQFYQEFCAEIKSFLQKAVNKELRYVIFFFFFFGGVITHSELHLWMRHTETKKGSRLSSIFRLQSLLEYGILTVNTL